jgi:integrase
MGHWKSESFRRQRKMTTVKCFTYEKSSYGTYHRQRIFSMQRHSFRHTKATLLGEVGESVKTAPAILGHSDLETTLNTYMHAIPDSQRRAVERVAGVLFPDVPKSGPVS